MNAKQDTNSVHSIEQQIWSITMSADERASALRAAYIGAFIADAIFWVCGKFTRPSVDVFAATSPKH